MLKLLILFGCLLKFECTVCNMQFANRTYVVVLVIMDKTPPVA